MESGDERVKVSLGRTESGPGLGQGLASDPVERQEAPTRLTRGLMWKRVS